MSTEQPQVRGTRTGGPGGTSAPVGSTVAIVVAVVAVVLGFLILRDIGDDDNGATGAPDDTTETIPGGSSTTVSSTPAPTTTTLTLAGAQVAVANASGVQGSARTWTTALQARGFTVADPANAAGEEARLDVSKVYVTPGSEAVGESVARVLGVTTEAMPNPIPVEGGSIGEATVLVMLGRDIAQRTLEEVEGGTAAATTPSSAVPSSAAPSSAPG